MLRGVGLAIAAVGVVLIVMGMQASDSFKERAIKAWDGTPSNRVLGLLGGGAACVGLGLGVALKGRGKA